MSKRAVRKVLKITPDIDPATVLCTTYQMRNFYRQLGDGFFSSLDVMNYIQHHAAVRMCQPGDHVLDVCCGRGLLLPLFRWHRKNIGSYTGVDIEPSNYQEAFRRACYRDISGMRFAPNYDKEGNHIGGKILSDDVEGAPYYPFPVWFIEVNVAEMTKRVPERRYQKVIYTSSIEHMQREAGVSSLRECYNVMAPGGTLFLSSPNTPDKQDPYDTQYAAHLYEWPQEELQDELEKAGFYIQDRIGLVAKVRGYEDKLHEKYPQFVEAFNGLKRYMPSAWLYGIFPILTPDIADEILFIARRRVDIEGKKK